VQQPKVIGARAAALGEAQFDVQQKQNRSQALLRRLFRIIVQGLIFIVLVSALFLRAPQVEGQSMLPNIQNGSHVLINTLAYMFDRPIRRGDVVAFVRGTGYERQVFLKRVIGLPGERIAITSGHVMINGAALKEAYSPLLDRKNMPGSVIPIGSVFVLGDNRAESDDSRSFGPVPRQTIVGRALLVIWPLGHVKAID
jgi:signal peptidase I